MEKLKTMNELMRYYDHRIEDLELKLAIAEEENAKLKARSLPTATGSTVLNAGAEAELYPDEIHEVLVNVIKNASVGPLSYIHYLTFSGIIGI